MDCPSCNGAMRRIHRSFWERFLYYALYECRDCKETQPVPRRITFYFGSKARCPSCGTVRLKRLHKPDRIDPMFKSPLNLLAGVFNGRLYHCAYCRIQFYDFRRSSSSREATTNKATPGE